MSAVFSDKMRWLSILGAVAMLMTHASTLQFYPGAGTLAAWAVQIGTELAVPAVAWFFFSSGYWLFRSLTPQQIPVRLKRRFFSLVVPFFAWNALVLAAECLLRLVKREPITLAYIALAFRPFSPVNGALWFVARLVSYVVFLPLLYAVMQKKSVSLVLIAAVAAAAAAVCPDYYSFFYWLPVFCMGGWLGLHGRERFEALLGQKGRLHWGWAVFAYCLLVILAHPAVSAGAREIYLVRVVSAAVIILLAAMAKCPAAGGWFLAQFSFYLFCTHWYVEAILGGKLAKIFPADLPGAAFLCYIALCGLTFAISALSMCFLHRFAPKLLAFLAGGRNG